MALQRHKPTQRPNKGIQSNQSNLDSSAEDYGLAFSRRAAAHVEGRASVSKEQKTEGNTVPQRESSISMQNYSRKCLTSGFDIEK